MHNKNIGYVNVATRNIIQHLYDVHASISAQDLSDNDECLKTPHGPKLPFETSVDQVDNAV